MTSEPSGCFQFSLALSWQKSHLNLRLFWSSGVIYAILVFVVHQSTWKCGNLFYFGYQKRDLKLFCSPASFILLQVSGARLPNLDPFALCLLLRGPHPATNWTQTGLIRTPPRYKLDSYGPHPATNWTHTVGLNHFLSSISRDGMQTY